MTCARPHEASVKKKNVSPLPTNISQDTHTSWGDAHIHTRHPLVCEARRGRCACSPLVPRLLIIIIYCWIMWMVMRGCSRSRITPAVFSHSRAQAGGARRKCARVSETDDSRALHVRHCAYDCALERDSTRDRYRSSVARSTVAM